MNTKPGPIGHSNVKSHESSSNESTISLYRQLEPRGARTSLANPGYVLSDFYYKYCSIKSTGLVNCTGFLLRVLILDFPKLLTAKRTVSIKSTGLINCTGFLLSVLIIGFMLMSMVYSYLSVLKNLFSIFIALARFRMLQFD